MISLTAAFTDPALQRRLAAALSGVLTLVLLWLLANLTWTLLAPVQVRPVTPAVLPDVATPATAGTIDLGRFHLFGEQQVNATVAAFHDAPETALQLELRGIVSSADPESGFAIIVSGGRQAVYGVAQELPGGAEVRGVYPDRVVLYHAGRYETLRLPVERAGVAGADAGPGRSPDPTNEIAKPPLAASLPGWRDKLSLSVDAASQYSLIPVAGGGYRVFLARDARQIVNMGLRNGDVITSANGIALNSQADVEQVIAKVLSGEHLNLMIVRDGSAMTLTPDVEQIMSGVR